MYEFLKNYINKNIIDKSASQLLKKQIQKKDEQLFNIKQSVIKQREAITRQREAIIRLKTFRDNFSHNMAINRFLNFARQCEENASNLNADVYCGHGVQTLPGVHILKQLNGGISMCDVIEVPEFSARAVPPKWHTSMLNTIDAASHGYLIKSDKLITIGWELQKILLKINHNTSVLPNYRFHSKPKRSTQLREKFDIPEDNKIILCLSTISSGYENLLEAIQTLPNNIHLISIGTFVPNSYAEDIKKLATKTNISERIHFLPPVPYEELTSIASEADIGIILLDPNIPNNKISLPNRVFDYMASELPILAPYMKDIDKIITEHGFGKSIYGTSAKDWASGILNMLPMTDKMSEKAALAHLDLCWETIEPDIPEMFGNPKSVTFLGYNDLSANNRTLRIANTLTTYGIKVKIAGPIDTQKTLTNNIEWYKFDKC